MAGSLKITCDLGETVLINTGAAFGTLNGATSWTIAFFYQFAAIPVTGTWSDLIQIGGASLLLCDAKDGAFNVRFKNGAGTKSIFKAIPLDTTGHHVLISGATIGTTTLYIDGIFSTSVDAFGPLIASDVSAFLTWNDGGHAGSFYLKDLAIWRNYAAISDDAVRLAIGTRTPANMTPNPNATNYWSLQGPAGAVAGGADGLNGQPAGSADLDQVSGSGSMTYDAHDITATPVVSVFFMTPYVDTTGYLLVIPLYLNPDATDGGPVPAYSDCTVVTPPVITVAGNSVTKTLLPHDVLCSMIVYQFTAKILAGQAVTMTAAMGWAVTTPGAVGGTSDAGLGSDPMSVLNYAGTAREGTPVTPEYKPAWNIVQSNDRGYPDQVLANWARRLDSLDTGAPADNNWRGEGTVTAYDVNNLPASFTGGVGADLLGYIHIGGANNGADLQGMPSLYGKWTLVYGDATAGVAGPPANTHVLELSLVTLSTGWTIGAPTITNAGEWDGSAWHKITKVYPVTWSPSGGFQSSDLMLRIARVDASGNPAAGGPVTIPRLANGQSELGIFEPSMDDPNVAATIDYPACFDPMALSPSWLARHAGSHSQRWMSNQLFRTTTGAGILIYPEDLDAKLPGDFLSTNKTTITLDITRLDPVSTSVATQIIIDYLFGNPSGTLPIPITPTHGFAIYTLVTTSAPHGIRTGDRFQLLPEVTVFLTGSGIDAVTTVIPLSAVTGLVAGMVLKIDAYHAGLPDEVPVELVQVLTIAGFNVTVTRATRGTPAGAKSSGTGVHPQFRAACSDSSYITLTAGTTASPSDTILHLSACTNINGDSECFVSVGDVLQLGPATTDEQVEVQSIAGLNVTVQRGARGTTPLAKSSGTVVYPCADINFGGLNDGFFAVSSTQLFVPLRNRALPRTATRTSTLHHAQTYAHGICPTFTRSVPNDRGTSTYELCAHATGAIAAANASGECICWVSVPFFIVDAAVTEVVNRMIPYFVATPGLKLIVQNSNEVFNGGFDARWMAAQFAPVAPNPQSGGTGFVDWYDYTCSRQHTFTRLARDAFEAASLDPDRVVWFQAGGVGFAAQASIAYCQTWGLPIRSFAVSFYADMYAPNLADTYVSWLPASTGIPGATAGWDLATARAVMGSNYRASIRYGAIGATHENVSQGLWLSRYNHGISVDGTAPANSNGWEAVPIRAQMCGYEGSTTQIIPLTMPGFPQCAAWSLAMQYDPDWYQTEWAFYEACQDAAYQYAVLMGDKFPDPADAQMEFGAYFSCVASDGPMSPTQGYMYTVYRWQIQQPGPGTGNRLDFWTASGGVCTAVGCELTPGTPPTINESVRGLVAMDWIAAVAGSPTPTPTPTPTLSSIVVTPADPSIVIGSTQQFTAIGHYSDSSIQNLTGSATWVSSGTAVATIAAGGLATAVGSGMTTISATRLGITGSTVLTVSLPMPASSFVAPGKATVRLPAGPDPGGARVVIR